MRLEGRPELSRSTQFVTSQSKRPSAQEMKSGASFHFPCEWEQEPCSASLSLLPFSLRDLQALPKLDTQGLRYHWNWYWGNYPLEQLTWILHLWKSRLDALTQTEVMGMMQESLAWSY